MMSLSSTISHFNPLLLCLLLPAGALADPFSITIAGAPETVYNYPTDHCQIDYNPWQQGQLDFPDEPARAFIGPDGNVQLLATNSHGLYRSIGGTSLNAPFKRDCSPILTSQYQNIGQSSLPSQYQNQLWIWSLWADEASHGKNVYALVHNEFHGELNPRYCASTDKNNCWYSNIIAAVSNDAGKTYQIVQNNRKETAPAFATPLPYVNDSGRHGMPNAINIVKNFLNLQDKNYYTLVLSMVCGPNQATGQSFCKNRPIDAHKWKNGMCLYRAASITQRANSPTLWLGYDDKTRSFDINSSQNPYTQTINPVDNAVCSPVLPSEFRFGLSYNSVLQQYIALGLGNFTSTTNGQSSATIMYAVSRGSLTDWDLGPNQQGYCIKDQQGQCMKILWMRPSPAPDVYGAGYPTLIDPNSPSISLEYGYKENAPDINFQFTGATPYLYYVTSYPKDKKYGMRHRDLMRIPLNVKVVSHAG